MCCIRLVLAVLTQFQAVGVFRRTGEPPEARGLLSRPVLCEDQMGE